jgi:hypothetical protein
MKKIISFLFLFVVILKLPAQKCLDISVSVMMGKLETPVDAEGSFKKCVTRKNDHGQVVIVNYGQAQVELDSMESRTVRDFSIASYAGAPSPSTQVPSQQQADAAKALADELKSMTPEQQKEWAKQMYLQKSAAGGSKTIQDDGPTMQQVMHARDIAVNQMKTVNADFTSKIQDLDEKCTNEINTLGLGDKKKCPMDLVGMPSCDCVNKIELTRWKQVVDIQNKYNLQKTAVYQIYYAKLKAMAVEVDNTVAKYKNGDDLKSSTTKGFLFTSQSSAFANAFLVTTYCVEKISKDGTTAYVNKVNCENGVYDISCSHQ